MRVVLDASNDNLGAKIRRAELDKVPYALVLGQKEAEALGVSVRSRARGDEGVIKQDDFVARVIQEIATRALPEKRPGDQVGPVSDRSLRAPPRSWAPQSLSSPFAPRSSKPRGFSFHR